MTTLEKVARAMWERNRELALAECLLPPWEDEMDGLREDWRALARAALEALRGPDQATQCAGLIGLMEFCQPEIERESKALRSTNDPAAQDKHGYAHAILSVRSGGEVSATFNAMIDAILSEGEG